MARRRLLPHHTPRNVASAIYGLVLGSSIIAAASADHTNDAGIVEIYLILTAFVFYLAHAYSRVIASWIEGETPSFGTVRRELAHEWPMVEAQLLPALALLLGVFGVLGSNLAITLAFAVSLGELMAGVVYACWKARATKLQAVLSVVAALAFALVVLTLKVLIH